MQAQISKPITVSNAKPRPLPKATVVIVNTNEMHHLRRCLPSVLDQQYPELEVVVVDNASTDGSVSAIEDEFPQVTVIKNETNLGYAGANNAGFKFATGEYIGVLNPDTEVECDWLLELILALESNPSAGLATSKILMMDDRERINACGNDVTFTGLTVCRGLGEASTSYNSLEVVPAVSGAAFAIRRSVLEQIGRFDESLFIYYEDTELSLRAMIAGHKCLYVPNSVLYHEYAFNFSPQKNFLLERNRLFTWFKIFRWQTLILMVPTLLMAEVISWGYALMRGPAYLRGKLSANWWLVRNWNTVLVYRHHAQQLRKVDDREILKVLTHKLSFKQATNRHFASVLGMVFQPLLQVFGRFYLWVVVW